MPSRGAAERGPREWRISYLRGLRADMLTAIYVSFCHRSDAGPLECPLAGLTTTALCAPVCVDIARASGVGAGRPGVPPQVLSDNAMPIVTARLPGRVLLDMRAAFGFPRE